MASNIVRDAQTGGTGRKANSALAIGTTFRHLKAMLVWGVDQGMLPRRPQDDNSPGWRCPPRERSAVRNLNGVLTVVRRGFRSGNVGTPTAGTYVSGGQGKSEPSTGCPAPDFEFFRKPHKCPEKQGF